MISYIIFYSLLFSIARSANKTAIHMLDWKFSEGGR